MIAAMLAMAAAPITYRSMAAMPNEMERRVMSSAVATGIMQPGQKLPDDVIVVYVEGGGTAAVPLVVTVNHRRPDQRVLVVVID